MLVAADGAFVHASSSFAADLAVLVGGRHKPFFNGYRPQFFFRTTDVNGELQLTDGSEMVIPGDTGVREGGKTVATGTVTKLLD